MYNVAIVDDDADSVATLRNLIEKYSVEYGASFCITDFRDGIDFCAGIQQAFDLVFMDIEMPMIDGMEAARRMRQVDQNACLIFVTDFAQYAVNGYEVDALDFIVKPLNYEIFKLKMSRAMKRLEGRKEDTLVLQRKHDTCTLAVSNIYYVEITNHQLTFYTSTGEISVTGSLKKIEDKLLNHNFLRCNNYTLVNLKYVTAVDRFSAVVGGKVLAISRSKKTQFLQGIADYHGGKI